MAIFLFNGPLESLGIGGLVQRLYWLVVAMWLLVQARRLLRVDSRGAGAEWQAA